MNANKNTFLAPGSALVWIEGIFIRT